MNHQHLAGYRSHVEVVAAEIAERVFVGDDDASFVADGYLRGTNLEETKTVLAAFDCWLRGTNLEETKTVLAAFGC